MKNSNQPKISVKRTKQGYVAYPIGVRGVIVGQGNSRKEAIADAQSAIRCHQKQFGP